MITKKNQINLQNKMEIDQTNETQVLEGDSLQDYFTKEGEEKKEEPNTATTLEAYFETPEEKEKVEAVEKVKTKAPEEKKVEAKPNFYTSLIKDFIEDGDWEDGAIEIEDEKGEVITVNLLDLTDVTPDQFKQIKAGQKALKDEELKSKYISIEGIDENTKKLIELKKAGGDTRELIQMDAEFINPLQGLDLDDERIQEHLVIQKYQSLGWKPKHIQAEIEELKENFQLDLEAKKIAEEVNTNFGRVIEEKKQERVNQVKQIEEDQKAFRKTITETYKSFKLDDKIVKTLVEATSKFDEYGLTNVDKAFFDVKKSNPELFAKVSHMLLDEKGFNEFQGIKIKNAVTKDTIKTIFKIAPRTSAATIDKSQGGLEEYFEKNK